MMDIVWMLDGSRSIRDSPGFLDDMKLFITRFTQDVRMGSTETRQGFVVFSGPENGGQPLPTIGANLSLTNPNANSSVEFLNQVDSIVEIGGTTNIAGAFDFVRTEMLTSSNARINVPRFVFLITDGAPTDGNGDATAESINATEDAAALLKQEDNIVLVFLQIGNDDIPAGFLTRSADHMFPLRLSSLLPLALEARFCEVRRPNSNRDQAAFSQLASYIPSSTFASCNLNNPCAGCSTLAERQVVVCETMPATKSPGQRNLQEGTDRITALRLGNLGLKDGFPLEILNEFSALRELSISSDPTATNPNTFSSCISEDTFHVCQQVECDLGDIHFCSKTTASALPIAIGVVSALVVLATVVVLVVRRRSQL